MGGWELVLILSVVCILFAAKQLPGLHSNRNREAETPRTFDWLITVLLALGFVFALLSLLESLVR